MQKFDLVVVTYEPFPYGQAATNRLLSYLVGLAESKRILYLCLAGVQKNNLNTKQDGIYKNINFKYLTDPTINNLNKIQRFAYVIYRYILLFFILAFKIKTKSILLYSCKKVLSIEILELCRLKKIKVFRDITEVVGFNYSKEKQSVLKLKRLTRKFNGIIVISKGIFSFYDNIPKSQKYLLPVLVDISRFNITPKREKYFFCCSGANLERDGLLDSLNGFLIFSKNHPEYVFEIASAVNPTDEYHKKCKAIIDKHSDVIHYLGALPSNIIPEKMCKASALLLTPHNEYQTKGFPTKLGEYLASATPTICSTITDLTEVLGKNDVLWVKPNSPNEIAEQLNYIICNRELSETIGKNGQNLMINKFTINYYKDSLIKFLDI